jgi:hypothetical protein
VKKIILTDDKEWMDDEDDDATIACAYTKK